MVPVLLVACMLAVQSSTRPWSCLSSCLCRPKDELLEKPLTRLQKSAAPPIDRQQRRAAQKGKDGGAADAAALPQPPFVGLHAGPSVETPVLDAGSLTNEQAWRQGRLLRIGDAQYRVELNPPLLDRLELHARPFVGIPLMPVVQVRLAARLLACVQTDFLTRCILPGHALLQHAHADSLPGRGRHKAGRTLLLRHPPSAHSRPLPVLPAKSAAAFC